jgi:hypothetical protein
MHFLISVIDDMSESATGDEAEAIEAFNEQLRTEGHWVVAGGIASPAESVVVDGRTSETHIRPGPLHDTQEFVAGFWIVEAAERDTAVSLAEQGSAACSRRVELRPLLGFAN